MPASGWSNSRISWKAITDSLTGRNFLDDKSTERSSSMAFSHTASISGFPCGSTSPISTAGRRHSSEHRATRRSRSGNGEQIYVGAAILILFWRTDRRTDVAAVEGRRRRDGTDWLFSGVTEWHSRSEQNKEDYEQACDFHLVSPCRSGG
jgi:hypothetical protein